MKILYLAESVSVLAFQETETLAAWRYEHIKKKTKRNSWRIITVREGEVECWEERKKDSFGGSCSYGIKMGFKQRNDNYSLFDKGTKMYTNDMYMQ